MDSADRRVIYYVIQFPDPNVLAHRAGYHQTIAEIGPVCLWTRRISSLFHPPSILPPSPHPFFLSNASKKKASLRELSRAPRSIRSRCRFPSPCPVIPTYLLFLLLPYDKARKYGRQASENKHGRIVKLLNRGVAGFTARSAIAFRQVAAL